LLAIACGGCGNTRSRPVGLSQVASTTSLVNLAVLGGDVSFGRPATWLATIGTLPEAAQVSSGDAVVTVYAYPRTDLPLDEAGAAASRQRLVASLRARDPSFEVDGSRLRKVDGAPAVEIVGRGRIAGHPVKTESLHVYKGAAEYVIDAYAPPGRFRRMREQALRPMLATIHLGGFPEGHVSDGVTAPR
jgi:hypothetical protein